MSPATKAMLAEAIATQRRHRVVNGVSKQIEQARAEYISAGETIRTILRQNERA